MMLKIEKDESLKVLRTQSVAARELYSIWKQSVDNTDVLKERMKQLVAYLVRITDPRQVKGPEIQANLREILDVIASYETMCVETGKAINLLYFTEGHGEHLYKLMKREEGLQGLGLQLDPNDNIRKGLKGPKRGRRKTKSLNRK